MRFEYQPNPFNQSILYRLYLLGGLFVLFLGYNAFTLPKENLPKFFLYSIVVATVLGSLLYFKINSQKKMWEESFLELNESSIIHKVKNNIIWEIPWGKISDWQEQNFKGIKSIRFTSENGVVSILELKDMNAFVKELKKHLGEPKAYELEQHGFFHYKHLVYFLPSILFLVLLMMQWMPEFINIPNYYLLLNTNAILFLMYLPKTMQMEKEKRNRYILLLILVFVVQVAWYWTNGFDSNF